MFEHNGIMYLQVCKIWIYIKNRKGGNREDAAPPQNAEYGTQGVYAGQHAYCDHMEHRLRQNRDSNRKRGEAQTRYCSYSGRIDFNKCPEILFSDRKKGLIRTLRENTFHSFHKNMQIEFKSKNNKSQETAKTNEPKQHQVHTFTMSCIDFIAKYFSPEIACYMKMTLLQNTYFYMRNLWGKLYCSFTKSTFATKDMSICRFLNNIYLHIPAASDIKFKDIRKNYRTFFGAF